MLQLFKVQENESQLLFMRLIPSLCNTHLHIKTKREQQLFLKKWRVLSNESWSLGIVIRRKQSHQERMSNEIYAKVLFNGFWRLAISKTKKAVSNLLRIAFSFSHFHHIAKFWFYSAILHHPSISLTFFNKISRCEKVFLNFCKIEQRIHSNS